MKRIVGGFAVVVLAWAFAAGDPDPAFGQTKGKAQPTRKEVAPPPKVGTIEVYKAKDGYRFRIKDTDGKTVAMPPKGYDEKDECLKTLDFIKATLNNVKPADVKD
jgi:uncharacterized protein YegP (UPF0339 family)